MVQSFRFAIVRLAPEDARGERINIGAVVFSDDGVDVRMPRRLDKIRVISAALDQGAVRDLAEAIADRDINVRNSGIYDVEARCRAIGRVGPLAMSEPGSFTCADEREYEARIASILNALVDPEPAQRTPRAKRSRLVTQFKKALREERVLATRDEDLGSHRVVTAVPLAEGLVADFVLKNCAMHVFETVDISSGETTARKAVTDIAVSALVLEQARINFSPEGAQTRLIYDASPSIETAARSCLEAAEHQGAELVNWASTSDRIKLITTITSLAVPAETRSERARRLETAGHSRLRLAE